MSASSPRPSDRAARSRQAGQSLVELALTLPILIVVLLGSINVGILLSDKIAVGFATRAGARLAAQLGAGGGTLSQSQVDSQVVRAVLASTANASFGTITEIDIYASTTTDGSYLATNLHDSYDGTGTATGAQTFLLASRVQVPPGETSIGVRAMWQFRPPTALYAINLQGLTEYTVMRAAPVLSG